MVGVSNCSMYCCTLLYVHSSIAIILMGKRELIALLNLSSWCLVMVERLFLAVPRGCLQFVIVVFPDHTHLLFLLKIFYQNENGGEKYHPAILKWKLNGPIDKNWETPYGFFGLNIVMSSFLLFIENYNSREC